jgi:hypothetical protein
MKPSQDLPRQWLSKCGETKPIDLPLQWLSKYGEIKKIDAMGNRTQDLNYVQDATYHSATFMDSVILGLSSY